MLDRYSIMKLLVCVFFSVLILQLAGCDNKKSDDSEGAATPVTNSVSASGQSAEVQAALNMNTLEMFSESLSTLGGTCSLDTVNGDGVTEVSVAPAADILFAGWATDSSGAVPESARLVMSNSSKSYVIGLRTGGLREDVAKAFNTDGVKYSGFTVNLSQPEIEAGRYNMFIVYSDGAACDLKKSIVRN